MSTLAIGTYIRLLTEAAAPIAGYAWQNFHQGQVRTLDSVSYSFAGFQYSGGSIDLESASITATVVLNLSNLSLNVFQEAALNNYLMEVNTVWLDPENVLQEKSTYSSEIYSVVSISHAGNRLTVTLGSPLIAVGAQTHRRLTAELVGSLPPNGSIQISG